MSDAIDGAMFDLMDPAIHADPYPAYARMRSTSPLCPIGGPQPAYAVSRHADVEHILKDHLTFSSELGLDVPLMSMVMKDAPDHTRLRSTVNRAFTPRAIQHLEPRIRAIVSDFASGLIGSCEFVSAFANPVPVTVICEMLGIPIAHRAQMNRHARDALLASFAEAGMGSPVLRAEAARGLAALMDILDRAIAAHIANPRDNIISALVQDEANGTLTRAEMRNLCALLLIAGQETTANLIASGVRRLATDAELFHMLKASPDSIPAFVEEMARLMPPLQRMMRRLTGPAEVAGRMLPEGTLLMVLPGSANRDDGRWDEPDRLDLTRNTRGHLGFGAGVHACPGAPLSRLEARIAFEVILESTDSITLDPERPAVPIVGYGAGSLGWTTLPLIFSAS